MTEPGTGSFQIKAWATPSLTLTANGLPQLALDWTACLTDLGKFSVSLVPGLKCLQQIGEYSKTAMLSLLRADVDVVRRGDPRSLLQYTEGATLDALLFTLSCAADFNPELHLISEVLSAASTGVSALETFNSCTQAIESTSGFIRTLSGTVVSSHDPNDKSGSVGVGSARNLGQGVPLGYAISFENSETATASAQQVIISDQLDVSQVDINTLSFGPISFGSQIVVPPSGVNTYTTDVDLRPAKNLLVRINASLNTSTGLLTWRYASIDPATNQPPLDPLAGFLPPNKTSPEGQGTVLFTVKPKAGLTTGAQIHNQASITFDSNAPILTPAWLNTIDASKPTSHALPLPTTQNSPSFTVQWTGSDTGSGIQDYTIYVSDNGGPFAAWLTNTASTQATYVGLTGHTYGFFSIARDLTGNIETSKTAGEATTMVQLPQVTMTLNRSALNFATAGSLVTSPQTVTLTFANGSGLAWTASSNKSNISVSPQSGAANATLQITATAGSSGVVTITAPGASNSPHQIQVNVSSAIAGNPFGSFDTPSDNITGVVGAIPVTGWALDNVEVTKVDIWREHVGSEPAGALIYIGDAVFVEGARPDVEGLYPKLPFSYRAGWGYQMLTNFLPNGNGTFKLHAIAHNKSGSSFDLGTKTIIVDNAHASKPFGTIDTPGQGGTVSGNAYINFGWALTQNPNKIAIDGSTISVVIDGQPVAHPTYNQFRSDIATLFPGYMNSGGAVGFYYIDTTKLLSGVHTISWNVFDNVGHGEGIGSRYFNVLNAGNGSIAEPPEEPLGPARNHPPVIEIEEVGQVVLPLDALSGYQLVNGEHRPLPIGSSLKRGVFYWQPGPGFLGEYMLVFQRKNGNQAHLRVKIRPKTFTP